MNTSSTSRRRVAATLAIASAALLSACFGGGDDDAAPVYSYDTAEAPPEGTFASSDAVLAFIVALGGSPLENREPYDFSTATPPTDSPDTVEPRTTSVDQ